MISFVDRKIRHRILYESQWRGRGDRGTSVHMIARTKKFSPSLKISVVLIALAFIFIFAYASPAVADDRESAARDRGTTGRTSEPDPAPAPAPAPAPKPTKPNQGGISNSTNGTANSGGNTGGNVTTGDEHVEIIVVNIGPTNPPAEEPEDEEEITPPPQPDPECGSDRRSQISCPAQSPTRGR